MKKCLSRKVLLWILTMMILPLCRADDASRATTTNDIDSVDIAELQLRAIQAAEARAEIEQQQEELTRANRQENRGIRSSNVRVRMLANQHEQLLDEARMLQKIMEDLDHESWPSLRERLLEKQKEYEEAWNRMKKLEERERQAQQAHRERRRQRNAVWTTTIRN